MGVADTSRLPVDTTTTPPPHRAYAPATSTGGFPTSDRIVSFSIGNFSAVTTVLTFLPGTSVVGLTGDSASLYIAVSVNGANPFPGATECLDGSLTNTILAKIDQASGTTSWSRCLNGTLVESGSSTTRQGLAVAFNPFTGRVATAALARGSVVINGLRLQSAGGPSGFVPFYVELRATDGTAVTAFQV